MDNKARINAGSQESLQKGEVSLFVQESFLGSLILRSALYYQVSDIVDPVMFENATCKTVCDVIWQKIDEKGEYKLFEIVAECEKKHGIDSTIINRFIDKADQKIIEIQARELSQQWHTVKEIEIHKNAIAEFYNGVDYVDVLSHSENERQLRDIYKGGNLNTTLISLEQSLQNIKDAKDGKRSKGVDTGFNDLNRRFHGWQPTDLIILAARPAMGKTALSLCYLLAALREGKRVFFFSLEMSNVQLNTRLISYITGVSTDDLRTGKVTDSELMAIEAAVDEISSYDLVLEDTLFDFRRIRDRALSLHRKKKGDLMFLDYLQLCEISGITNREQQISTISRGCKMIAKQTGMPVIALSQLSRAVETRGGSKRPQLSDLRESGAIEQDADIIQFIYRPEYYHIIEDEEGQSLKGLAEIINAKYRNGTFGTDTLRFENGTFKDLEDPNFVDLVNDKNIPLTAPESTTITQRIDPDKNDIPF